MTDQKRHPAGTPKGGKFAPEDRADSGVTLESDDGQLLPHGVNENFILKKGKAELISSLEQYQRENTILTRISYSRRGSRGVATMNKTRTATILAYWQDRHPEEYQDAKDFIKNYPDGGLDSDAPKIGILGKNAITGGVDYMEGRAFTYYNGEKLILPKGQRKEADIVDEAYDVVAVRAGYGHAGDFAEELKEAEKNVPTVGKPTIDGIPEIDYGDPPTNIPIAAAYLLRGPQLEPDTDVNGCVFFASDQQDGEVINGYLWTHDSSGLYSEFGSMYVEDLEIRGAGRINGIDSSTGIDLKEVDTLSHRFSKRADMMDWLSSKISAE